MDVKSIIIICLLASAGTTIFLSLYASRKISIPGAKAYIGVMICVAIYSVGYAAELSSVTLAGIKQSLRVEYLGLPFIPAFWVFLALKYTGYYPRMPRWFYMAVLAIPVLTTILHLTNDYHHLFYRGLGVNRAGPFPLADISKGTWYYVFVAYANISMLAGSVLFLRMMLRMKGTFSKQAAILFVASLFPLAANFIYQQGLTPYHIDIVPFALTVIGPLGAIALFRFRMFDLVPIARDTLFDVTLDPVLILDNFNRLADFNQAAAKLFPALAEVGVGNQAAGALRAYPDLERLVEQKSQGHHEIEVQNQDRAQIYDTSLIPIEYGNNRRQVGNLLILHDITKQKLLVCQLERLATIDGLTGISNRRHLMELSRKELSRAGRSLYPVSLILMDLDHFKQVNDTHGHQVGDQVLRGFADTIQQQLRACDIFGRYGGEEFGVMLPETNLEVGEQVAERLRKSLENHVMECGGPKISITASFGVSSWESNGNGDTENVESLYKRADEALYLAKKNGRNRVELQ